MHDCCSHRAAVRGATADVLYALCCMQMALKLALVFLGPALVLAFLSMQVDPVSRTWFGAR